jgi:transposase-like protein
MNLSELAKNFSNADEAREFLEKQRWPSGVVCPHCGVVGESYRLVAKAGAKTHVRPGVWKCVCRKQFTVTVGTIFEDSHIPLHKWLMAIHLLCASKKGMSSHQIHRMLGVTYKTAWFMTHRIREAMAKEPLAKRLSGTVEVDETYVGGKPRHGAGPRKLVPKAVVVSLVERDGRVKSVHIPSVSSKNLKAVMANYISPNAEIMTDDFASYGFVKHSYPRHDIIKHKNHNYARREGSRKINTNTVEGFFSLVKRGIVGTFHHVSKRHLQRYLNEFDFRYNSRHIDDGSRTLLAIKGATGKRLTYRTAKQKSVSCN